MSIKDSRQQATVIPVIVRLANGIPHKLHGDGAITKLIYPENVGSVNFFCGMAEIPPGSFAHVFHRHAVEVHGNTQIAYSPDFEEFYFVHIGEGTMQWREDENSELFEQPVAAGDCIYMPPGVVEHRMLNTGEETMFLLYGGTPPAVVDVKD